jgi:hypothetical protein
MSVTIADQVNRCAEQMERLAETLADNDIPCGDALAVAATLAGLAEIVTAAGGSLDWALDLQAISNVDDAVSRLADACRAAGRAEKRWTRNKWEDLADLLDGWSEVHGHSQAMRAMIALEQPTRYSGVRPKTVTRAASQAKHYLASTILSIEATHDPGGHWGAIGGVGHVGHMHRVSAHYIERWAAAIDGRRLPPHPRKRDLKPPDGRDD